MTPEQVVEQALAAGRVAGADDVVVVLERQDATNLRWAANQLTTTGTTSTTSVGVVAVQDSAAGRAYGSLTRQVGDPDALQALVADAVVAARRSGPAEDAAELPVGPVSDDFAAEPEAASPERLSGTAAALGRLFEASQAQQREMFGFAEHVVATTWTASSTGTRHRSVEPYGTVELNGKSHARSRSAWAGAGTRDFIDVDVDALAAEVVQGLHWQGRRVDVAPGRHRVLLPPSAVADLMGEWLFSADARTASEGRGVFARPGGGTRVGERLTSSPLTVRDDPHHPVLGTSDRIATTSTSATASVFDNGLEVPGTRYLDGGVLRALPATRHTAGLAGTPVAPFAGNLLVDVAGGSGDVADLVARMGSGLLLTCLWYVRTVDEQTMLMTGLTRDGVYVVRDGEVVGAAGNFRFNDSPAALLGRVLDAGAPTVCLPRELGDYLPRAAAPPLLVGDFHLSSASEAA
ncbi:metallopeptidase TldD-related protein [Aquipuribacter sp. MA13-6]|uniref:metallopeptidase TldD-related protein n=1 Tax=unclassified Aquipuribacter TaxID=2635084 RepID=UPI003EEA4434